MTKVWDCPHVGGGSELLALLALADWSDDEGRCWPSMENIARKIRLSEKQARRIVHALIEAGLVEVIGHHQGGRRGMTGDGFSRQYRIAIERLSTLPPVSSTLPPVSLYPPTHGRQPVIEPSIEPSNRISLDANASIDRLPEWLDVELWDSYVDHYHELRAINGEDVPAAWKPFALNLLSNLVADGNDPDVVLQQAIDSDRGMLLPVNRRGHAGRISA
jgi:hypothetical protein